METLSIQHWLMQARQSLTNVDYPELEARLILGKVLGRGKPWLMAHSEVFLTSDQTVSAAQMLAARLKGLPLPYLLGEWEFYGLPFYVNEYTLIPRPETELLVETALAFLNHCSEVSSIADVGTGSGCIAISITQNYRNCQITASDISFQALKVARQNCQRHDVAEWVSLVNLDLLQGLRTKFHLICANLPYIPSATLEGLEVKKHEPVTALDGGHDGLDFIRTLLRESRDHLHPGGMLLAEIEYTQEAPVLSLAQSYFPEYGIQIKKDLSGLPRLLVIN